MVILYVLAIVAANVLTAALNPLILGPVIVPAGSLLIGVTFILRDLVQRKVGREKTYFWIVVALIASAITSGMLGDGFYIVLASAASFLLSETIDTEIFTHLKKSFAARVFISGIVGGAVGSIIFVVVALSPIGLGILTWKMTVWAVFGQFTIKLLAQSIAVIIIKRFGKK